MCTPPLACPTFEQVLEEAQRDLVNYKGTGMSIMEMSHRGKEYEAVIRKAEADLRKLLSVPDNYKILFLQGRATQGRRSWSKICMMSACFLGAGGATLQFAQIPLNITKEGDVTDYIVTGAWSKKALEEGQKYTKANVAAKVSWARCYCS